MNLVDGGERVVADVTANRGVFGSRSPDRSPRGREGSQLGLGWHFHPIYTICMSLNAGVLRRGILFALPTFLLSFLTLVRRRRSGPYVTAPPVKGKGSPGPLYPGAENPYDLLFD